MEQLAQVITYREMADLHNQQLLAVFPDAASVIAATNLTAESSPDDFALAVEAERERRTLLARYVPGANQIEVALSTEELTDTQTAIVWSRGLAYLRELQRADS